MGNRHRLLMWRPQEIAPLCLFDHREIPPSRNCWWTMRLSRRFGRNLHLPWPAPIRNPDDLLILFAVTIGLSACSTWCATSFAGSCFMGLWVIFVGTNSLSVPLSSCWLTG